jgi:hypothetical protein
LQQTIVLHVDNLKSSHKSKSVNNKFEKWFTACTVNMERLLQHVDKSKTTSGWNWTIESKEN